MASVRDTATPLASIDLVFDELNRSQDSLERRSASLDTKAGLILAAAAVLITRPTTSTTTLGLLVQVGGAIAGAFAAGALLPRVSGALSPLMLRKQYVHLPDPDTKLVILDTRIMLYGKNEKRLHAKLRRFWIAVVVLFAAFVLAVANNAANPGTLVPAAPVVPVSPTGPTNPTPPSAPTTPADSG
jgi:hypothetical protein